MRNLILLKTLARHFSRRHVGLYEYVESSVCQIIKGYSDNVIIKRKFDINRTFEEYGIDYLERTRIIGGNKFIKNVFSFSLIFFYFLNIVKYQRKINLWKEFTRG